MDPKLLFLPFLVIPKSALELWEEIFFICAARGYSRHNVVGVCSPFQRLAEPILWRRVIVDGSSQWVVSRFLVRRTVQPYRNSLYGHVQEAVVAPIADFLRAPHLVRMNNLRVLKLDLFRTAKHAVYLKLLGSMPHLTRLALGFNFEAGPLDTVLWPQYLTPNLTSLYLLIRCLEKTSPSSFGSLIAHLASPRLKELRLVFPTIQPLYLNALEDALEDVSLEKFEIVRYRERDPSRAGALMSLLTGQKDLIALGTGPISIGKAALNLQVSGPPLHLPLPDTALPKLRRFRGDASDVQIVANRPVEKVHLLNLDRDTHFDPNSEDPIGDSRRMTLGRVAALKLSARPIVSLRLEVQHLYQQLVDFVLIEFPALEELSIHTKR